MGYNEHCSVMHCVDIQLLRCLGIFESRFAFWWHSSLPCTCIQVVVSFTILFHGILYHIHVDPTTDQPDDTTVSLYTSLSNLLTVALL